MDQLKVLFKSMSLYLRVNKNAGEYAEERCRKNKKKQEGLENNYSEDCCTKIPKNAKSFFTRCKSIIVVLLTIFFLFYPVLQIGLESLAIVDYLNGKSVMYSPGKLLTQY